MIIAFSTVVLDSCSTPMERARDICNQMGNPSPACVERHYNNELAWLDERHRRMMENINSGIPPSPSQQPTESEYDRRVREFEGQAKDRCESGQVFKKYGNSWTCENPKVSPQPRENEKCRNYAQRAIQQHAKTIPIENCRLPVSARWSSDYQAHYDWCLRAQDAWLYSEEKARKDHLYNCRQPRRLDNQGDYQW